MFSIRLFYSFKTSQYLVMCECLVFYLKLHPFLRPLFLIQLKLLREFFFSFLIHVSFSSPPVFSSWLKSPGHLGVLEISLWLSSAYFAGLWESFINLVDGHYILSIKCAYWELRICFIRLDWHVTTRDTRAYIDVCEGEDTVVANFKIINTCVY